MWVKDAAAPGRGRHWKGYRRRRRNRRALLTTVTELMLIAAAAITGLSKMPKKG